MSRLGVGLRLVALALFFALILPPHLVALRLDARAGGLAPLLFHRLFLRLFGVRVVERGTPPPARAATLVLANHVSACLALIGNGITPGKGGTPLHSHDYTFNDDILTDGVAYYRQVVRISLRTDKETEK